MECYLFICFLFLSISLRNDFLQVCNVFGRAAAATTARQKHSTITLLSTIIASIYTTYTEKKCHFFKMVFLLTAVSPPLSPILFQV